MYQSKEKQSVGVARVSARSKHPHEPIVALEPQWPLLSHRHVLSHLPCHRHVVEDSATEQTTRVHYHLS
jgi:hypothetical protein